MRMMKAGWRDGMKQLKGVKEVLGTESLEILKTTTME